MVVELVQLINRPQYRQATRSIRVATQTDRLKHPIQHLPTIDLDYIVAALHAQRFQRIRRQHAHLGVRRDAVRANRVGIKLHELAEAPRAGLFIAVDIPERIPPKRLRQPVEILSYIAR